jgi:hypothetical protein
VIEAPDAFDNAAGLLEMAKHAHRALNDAALFIQAVDPESATEGEMLRQLAERCAAISTSLFCLTRDDVQTARCTHPNATRGQVGETYRVIQCDCPDCGARWDES